MLAQVGQVVERSNDIEFLVDSGAACHAWPCRTIAGSSYGETFLTATGAPVASQGTLEVKFQLVDVHGEKITVKATFELLPLRRPILSVSRLAEKGWVCCCHRKRTWAQVVQEWQRDTSSQIQRCVSRQCNSVVGVVPIGGFEERQCTTCRGCGRRRMCHGHGDFHTNPQRTR